MRLATLVILSLVLAVGALVVLENAELRKIWPATPLRTTLVFMGPVAAIWLLNFTLAMKSFGHRSLVSETLVGLAPTLIYSGVTLSMIGRVGKKTPCPRWDLFCTPAPMMPEPDLWLMAPFLLAAAACLGLLVWRERGR